MAKYIIDHKTKNLSFLQTARDLRTLGIDNCTFFLRLYDESLQGIDPFSPMLSEEYMFRIINECFINPWYYLRECVRIPEQGGSGMPYQLHRANLAQAFCFLLGIDTYVVIPRQKGKTQSTMALILWSFLFGTSNSEIALLNKRERDAIANLKRLKDQRDLLPVYLQGKITIDLETNKEVKETNNVKTLYNPGRKNGIIAQPAATSVDAAESIGRGTSQPIQYYDEVEFTNHIKTIVEAAGPAFIIAKRNARKNKATAARLFTSTPGDLDSKAGTEAALILKETCKWSEHFYDWDLDDIEEFVKRNSVNRIVYIEYTYQQLGEGQDWFDEQCAVLNNDSYKIKRELLLKRMRGSADSPFEPHDLETLQSLKGNIVEEIFINKTWQLNLYTPLIRDRIYLVGFDVAEGYGEGRDSSAAIILDPYTLEVVGEFNSPYISPKETEHFLMTLVSRHIPKSIVIIERNKGGPLIDALRQSAIARNIYFENDADVMDKDVIDVLDTKGFLKREAAKRRLFGIWTGTKSRARMFDLLHGHVSEYKEKFISRALIDEIMGLVVAKSGKIVAGPTSHDDVVMAYLMCIFVYYHGKNLSRFGFVKGNIPDDESRNRGLSFEETMHELPAEITEHFKDFSVKSNDDYVNRMHEHMQTARRESNHADSILRPKTYAEDFDSGDTSGHMDLSLFDELNK